MPSNATLSVNTVQAEELAGYHRDAGDKSSRPVTSDGVFNKSGLPLLPDDRQAASADATIPVPLPTWGNSTGVHPSVANGGLAAYRPQPHYQRMLAAKMANDHQTGIREDEGQALAPPINPSDMAYLPSSYSPMYQIFSQGGGLDSHYQAQHTPHVANTSWNMQAPSHTPTSAHFPTSTTGQDSSYLGLVNGTSHYTDATTGYPQPTPQSGANAAWHHYYPSDSSSSQSPALRPGYPGGTYYPSEASSSHTPQSRGGGPVAGPSGGGGGTTTMPFDLGAPHSAVSWRSDGTTNNNTNNNNSDNRMTPTLPAATDDWMAVWPHIKNSASVGFHNHHHDMSVHGQSHPTDLSSSSSRTAGVKRASHGGTSGRSGKASKMDSGDDKGDAPKKAALACHFCRGRKLK